MNTNESNITETALSIMDEYYNFLRRYKIDASSYRLDFYALNDIAYRYWRDVERLHSFHDMPLIDCYKIAGYTAYWICKLRPISVVGNKSYTVNPKFTKFINEAFAVRYACGRINSEYKVTNSERRIVLSRKLFDTLLYSLKYRTLPGDAIALFFEGNGGTAIPAK